MHERESELMRIRRQVIYPLVFPALLSFSATCGEMSIIELKHRTADEVIRIVTPLLGPEDTITGRRYTVILTAVPERAGRIESIIRNLDKPARQLLLIVVQGENAGETLEAIDISGNLSPGDHAGVEFGRHPQPDDTVAVMGRSARSAKRQADIQRLRVREGMPAVLSIGQMLPVSTRTVDPRARNDRIAYQQVRTGFRVVPRLSGNRYVLGIAAQRESSSAAGHQAPAAQQLQTQIQGRLDEWLDIGGILNADRRSESGFVHSDERQERLLHPVYLKIVEIAR